MGASVVRDARRQGFRLVTAESCTGGLLASLLTVIDGLSDCFERGFTVYSEEAKSEMLGIDRITIARHGAVSWEVAIAMAKGALANSRGDLSIAITGFAGPAGPADEEGLVHVAVCTGESHILHRECHFGNCGRDRVRAFAVRAGLEMLDEILTSM